MNKKKIRIGIVFLLVAGLIAGSVYRLRRRENAPINALRLYGNVDIRQSRLAFYDIGRIERLLVQEGDAVEPGQLVAEMDSARYEMAVKEAEGKECPETGAGSYACRVEAPGYQKGQRAGQGC